MTVTLAEPTDLDLAAFARVAWNGEGVELAPEAIDRMAFDPPGVRRVRGRFGRPPSVRDHNRPSPRRADAALARRPGRLRAAHPADAGLLGPPLPERVVRGIVAARVAGFIAGTAAVRPELAGAVAAMLDRPMPSVPARGHGEPGEIGTLRALFGGLEHDVVLEAKEGMALVNGAPTSAAVLADVALGRSRPARARR